MFHIAIVEDNLLFRNQLHHCINTVLFDMKYEYRIYEYGSVEDFDKSRCLLNYQFLFLDVELPGKSGLELAKTLYLSQSPIIVVFLTSHEAYMKDAFGLNVYRYILKSEYEKKVPITLSSLIKEQLTVRDYIFNTVEGSIRLKCNEIVSIELIGRNPVIRTASQEKIVLRICSLKSIYEMLNSQSFLYINSNTIINIHYIKSFKGREIKVQNNDKTYTVSRGKQRFFYTHYKQMLFEGDLL